jgi:putative oxidoreductase
MKHKILFVLCLLVGLLMINAGLNKFFNYMPMPDKMPEAAVKMMAAVGQIGWLMPLVGAVEVVAGVLLIIPRFRALAALMLLPIMVGILLTNIYGDPSGLPIVAVLFAILGWAMYEDRRKLLPIVR